MDIEADGEWKMEKKMAGKGSKVRIRKEAREEWGNKEKKIGKKEKGNGWRNKQKKKERMN